MARNAFCIWDTVEIRKEDEAGYNEVQGKGRGSAGGWGMPGVVSVGVGIGVG